MSIDHQSTSYWLQLWLSRVGEASHAAENRVREWLSATERERLQRIRHDGKRREYLLSRMLMRHALSQNFAQAADEWRFAEQTTSAPHIDQLPEGIHFSLGHSDGYVCFGLANCALGIDIEINRPRRDLGASAEIFMDSDEREYLLRGEMADRDYFYRNWCAKEACYKSLSADDQSTTLFAAISYTALLAGNGQRKLIEGGSDDYRFAAVMAQSPSEIEQYSFLISEKIVLEGIT